MPDNRIIDQDFGFPYGMRSAGNPAALPPGSYVFGFNTVSRGGVVHCRPGYNQRLRLADGNLQGLTWFKPAIGEAQLVFAIEGLVYFSLPPFDTYERVPGVEFSALSRWVFFARAEQSVRRNADNSRTLIASRPLLMIQDGATAPAYWDGAKGEHIFGDQTTPVGTVMAWSGGRLWVARDQFVFASDIYNPLSFEEGQYVGEQGIGAFVLPSRVTAMAEVPSTEQPILLVFTDQQTTAFQSNIRNRDLWESTPDFQKVVLPDVGCVAPFSVVSHYGYLWWMSSKGIVNLNVALSTRTTSALRLLDTDMAFSKRRLDPDLSGVAFGAHGGYLLASVPYADVYNRHTWCLDMTGLDNLTEDALPGWAGFWTGTRPVQWTNTTVNGKERIFHISKDRDGKNRLWEAFQDDKDNGCPITWGFLSRGYLFQSPFQKEFKYVKVFFADLQGAVDIHISWAAMLRGVFHTVCTKRVEATQGSLSVDVELSAEDSVVFGSRRQARTLKTEDARTQYKDPFDSCGIESGALDDIDIGFQVCVLVNGPGAVTGMQLYARPEDIELRGNCEEQETPVRMSRFDGAGSHGDVYDEVIEALAQAPTVFCANATATGSYSGVSVVGVGHACTTISQAAADKLAASIAQMRVARKLVEDAPPYLGGWGEGCVLETAIE